MSIGWIMVVAIIPDRPPFTKGFMFDHTPAGGTGFASDMVLWSGVVLRVVIGRATRRNVGLGGLNRP